MVPLLVLDDSGAYDVVQVTRPPLPPLASLAPLLRLPPFLLPQRPRCRGGMLGLQRPPSADLALQKS